MINWSVITKQRGKIFSAFLFCILSKKRAHPHTSVKWCHENSNVRPYSYFYIKILEYHRGKMHSTGQKMHKLLQYFQIYYRTYTSHTKTTCTDLKQKLMNLPSWYKMQATGSFERLVTNYSVTTRRHIIFTTTNMEIWKSHILHMWTVQKYTRYEHCDHYVFCKMMPCALEDVYQCSYGGCCLFMINQKTVIWMSKNICYGTGIYHRARTSCTVHVKAWPRCKVPVTFGGGRTMLNGFPVAAEFGKK
jgi:hypothetical protein